MKKTKTISLAYALQERLVQTCIDFIKETNTTLLDRVVFNADSLQESSKHGEWMPCTDSYCSIESWDEENECYKIESESN